MSEPVSPSGKGLIKLLEETDGESEISESNLVVLFREAYSFVIKERGINLRKYEESVVNAITVEKFFAKGGQFSRYVCIFVNTEIDFVSIVYSWTITGGAVPEKVVTIGKPGSNEAS
jgi:hypothetical protein